MSQSLITQEFGIIIAAKNHNPTLLNPDFLKYRIISTKFLAKVPDNTTVVPNIFTMTASAVA